MRFVHHLSLNAAVQNLNRFHFHAVTATARHLASVARAARKGTVKAIHLTLILTLLAVQTPAAPTVIMNDGSQLTADLAFSFLRAKTWWRKRRAKAQGRAVGQEKQSDRDAKVARLEIHPGDVTIKVGEPLHLTTIAYDSNGDQVSGIPVTWKGEQLSVTNKSANPLGKQVDTTLDFEMPVLPHGEFVPTIPGTAKITAKTKNGQEASITVTIEDAPLVSSTTPRTVIGNSSTRDPIKVHPLVKRASLERQDSPSSQPVRAAASTVRARRVEYLNAGYKAESQAPITKAFSASKRAGMLFQQLPAQDDPNGWNTDNHGSVSDPDNGIGNPPGGAQAGGAGSGNFQLAAPVVALPGRGLSVTLALAYNSRLWTKSGNDITYDIDHGWPSPGWNLGFGKLESLGYQQASLLVDADGTRHAASGTVSTNSGYTYFSGNTTDGTLIDYSTQTTNDGVTLNWGSASYPNGTLVSYGAPGNGAIYPTLINDPQGNFITITYRNNQGPQIDTITDTLGRVIQFYYDSNNLLTAITAPGISQTMDGNGNVASNSSARTLVRLHYRSLSLGYSFNLNTHVRSNPVQVLDAIYYPATNTGYWFGDTDSYSSFGMIAKVRERRGMGFSASSLTDQGTITSSGTPTKEMDYSYPLSTSDSGGSNLTDAPTYSSLIETWDGMDTSQAETDFVVNENASPRTVTITLPNQTKSIQYSYNHPGQYDDGLVYYDETQDSNSHKLKSSTATWQLGDYGSPRPTRVESSTFTAQGQELKTATEFSYGPAGTYNQVTEVRAYDYGGTTLLRKTDTQYQNSVSYTSRHIFNLPTVVEVYAADGTRASRTEIYYDGATLVDTPNVTQHLVQYDPYAQAYPHVDSNCMASCMQQNNNSSYCLGQCTSTYSDYNPNTAYRGNVTQVTTYADAQNLAGAITETRSYDKTGNMVTATTSCCQQMSFTFTSNTQYAYPETKKRGSPSDTTAQVTTSATYDFNTGLVFSSTDANGRTTTTGYAGDTLRPVRAILPSGAYTQFGYDDNAMTVSQTTYTGSGGSIADQNTKYLNGLGLVHHEEATGANGAIDAVDTQYDKMAQVWKQSRPYRMNQESAQWTTTTYDPLGRTASVQAPDGSTTSAYYNEGYSTYPSAATSNVPGETTRVVDAWGRERWGRTDAFGRLVEVVEPDPQGNGTVASNGLLTSYSYNSLDKLTDVYQGAQHRQFKYDSLGRLTAQKLAEASATLNDSGTYVGGGSWSDVFTYDVRSNMTSHTDARGVKTVFNYNSDPLNRVQSVSYDTSGFGDTGHQVQSSPTVSYTYMTTGDVTRVSAITVAGVVTENYSYNDTEARLTDKTVTLTSRSSYPMVTSYVYDTLDRVTDVRYPAEYGVSGSPRKVVHQDYDVASRVNNLTVDGTSYASSLVYNAASQTTTLNIGNGSGGGQLSESYTYDAQTGLLTNQKVQRAGAPNALLDLTYSYVRPNANAAKTGQLTAITNNLDASHNHDRSFVYDKIGRLQQATGGNPTSPLWTQTYTFDRYGNRTTVAASGNAAGTMQTACSGSQTLAVEQFVQSFYQSALNRQPTASELQQQTERLKDAFFQGQSQLLTAAQNMGQQIFTSAEYVNRNRATADYVSDLYYAFLGRAPDGDPNNPSTGWGFWVQNTNNNGRQATLNAFEAAGDFSNRVGTLCPNVAGGNGYPIPVDGLANLSFDSATNHITSPNFEYDAAGNQTKIQRVDGSIEQLQYDAAGRVVNVKDGNNTTLATYTYGVGSERLIVQEGSYRTYYAWSGSGTTVEYTEVDPSTSPQWTKSYIYLGNRLLATVEPSGTSEYVSYQHPDRLGTRLITNNQNTNTIEQVHLPFGSALDGESTGATNKRFTSYDRSTTTGLDYAINRHYDPQQGRFTTVDPIGVNKRNSMTRE